MYIYRERDSLICLDTYKKYTTLKQRKKTKQQNVDNSFEEFVGST